MSDSSQVHYLLHYVLTTKDINLGRRQMTKEKLVHRWRSGFATTVHFLYLHRHFGTAEDVLG